MEEIPKEYERMAEFIVEENLINSFVKWKTKKMKGQKNES
jgi:hypothetical protein